MSHRSLLIATLSLGGAATLPAQSIPVVDLPSASAHSADKFGAIVNVRELPGGRLLVDDGKSRQVKLLSAALTTERVVLDSTNLGYGRFPLPLIAYPGDSTLMVNMNGLGALHMIDPSGTEVRTVAMPQNGFLAQVRARAFTDDKGRLVFMGQNPVTRRPATGVVPTLSDSAPLLRVDFAARTTDTIGQIVRPQARVDIWTLNTSIELSFWLNDPLKAIDEWTVLRDGSIAIVRGHDYRVDWRRSDGTTEASPKLPFDWKQMSEADKVRLIDTVHAQWIAAARNNSLLSAPDHSPVPWSREAMSGSSDPNAPKRPSFDTTKAERTTAVLMGPPLLARIPDRPSPDEVSDFYAPIRAGGAFGDLDNRLWILPTVSKQSRAGELVYDVVSRNGEMLERVRVPLGRYIVGFGRDGVVYLATGNLSTGFTIERSKLP